VSELQNCCRDFGNLTITLVAANQATAAAELYQDQAGCIAMLGAINVWLLRALETELELLAVTPLETAKPPPSR
jgi:hypothetical protein